MCNEKRCLPLATQCMLLIFSFGSERLFPVREVRPSIKQEASSEGGANSLFLVGAFTYFGVFGRESLKSHVVDRRENSASVTQ